MTVRADGTLARIQTDQGFADAQQVESRMYKINLYNIHSLMLYQPSHWQGTALCVGLASRHCGKASQFFLNRFKACKKYQA